MDSRIGLLAGPEYGGPDTGLSSAERTVLIPTFRLLNVGCMNALTDEVASKSVAAVERIRIVILICSLKLIFFDVNIEPEK